MLDTERQLRRAVDQNVLESRKHGPSDQMSMIFTAWSAGAATLRLDASHVLVSLHATESEAYEVSEAVKQSRHRRIRARTANRDVIELNRHKTLKRERSMTPPPLVQPEFHVNGFSSR